MVLQQRQFWPGQSCRSLSSWLSAVSATFGSVPVPASFNKTIILLFLWLNTEIVIPQPVQTLRLSWMNPRLDVRMLSFHWVKFNPIFRFLDVICVDCAAEFNGLEMPLSAGLPTATEWCCQSKFLQLSLNLPSFLLVLLYQHTSSWYCASVVNLLHNSRVVFFFLYIFCTHSVSVQDVYVCACTVSMVMQYGFGRGRRWPEDILTFVALAIIRKPAVSCVLCCRAGCRQTVSLQTSSAVGHESSPTVALQRGLSPLYRTLPPHTLLTD